MFLRNFNDTDLFMHYLKKQVASIEFMLKIEPNSSFLIYLIDRFPYNLKINAQFSQIYEQISKNQLNIKKDVIKYYI